jgi:hypothetical protein
MVAPVPGCPNVSSSAWVTWQLVTHGTEFA